MSADQAPPNFDFSTRSTKNKILRKGNPMTTRREIRDALFPPSLRNAQYKTIAKSPQFRSLFSPQDDSKSIARTFAMIYESADPIRLKKQLRAEALKRRREYAANVALIKINQEKQLKKWNINEQKKAREDRGRTSFGLVAIVCCDQVVTCVAARSEFFTASVVAVNEAYSQLTPAYSHARLKMNT